MNCPTGTTIAVIEGQHGHCHKQSANPSEVFMTNSPQSFVHDPHTTISNVETFPEYFTSNSEANASELLEKILEIQRYVMRVCMYVYVVMHLMVVI